MRTLSGSVLLHSISVRTFSGSLKMVGKIMVHAVVARTVSCKVKMCTGTDTPPPRFTAYCSDWLSTTSRLSAFFKIVVNNTMYAWQQYVFSSWESCQRYSSFLLSTPG